MHHEGGRPVDLTLHGTGHRLTVAETGPGRHRVGFPAGDDVRAVDAVLERFDEHTGQIRIDGHRFLLVSGPHGPVHLVEIDGVTHRISRDDGVVVRSPARH